MLAAGHVRPTALSRRCGMLLALRWASRTALLGEKAAHACTEAVETVIEEHYGDQVTELTAAGEDELAAQDGEVPGRGSRAQGSRGG